MTAHCIVNQFIIYKGQQENVKATFNLLTFNGFSLSVS